MESIVAAGLRPLHVIPLHSRARLNAHLEVIPPRESIAFVRIRFGADVVVLPSAPAQDRFTYGVNLSGIARFRYGNDEALISPGECGFIPPHRPFRTQALSALDQLLMVIDREKVEQIASTVLGREIDTLEFDYRSDIRLLSSELSPIIEAALMLSTEGSPPSAFATLRKLEEVVIEAALLTNPSFRLRLPHERPARNRAVRAAMEYIVENFRSPLSVTDIARNAMVSPRALQLGFKKETGLSPIRWLRARRLDHARGLLTSSEAGRLRIADVAYDSGFLHMGDFSRRYVEQFGEAPSTTRRRAIDDATGARDTAPDPHPRSSPSGR